MCSEHLQSQKEIKPLLKQLAFRLSQGFLDFPLLGSKLLPSFSPSLLELSPALGPQARTGLILHELCCLVTSETRMDWGSARHHPSHPWRQLSAKLIIPCPSASPLTPPCLWEGLVLPQCHQRETRQLLRVEGARQEDQSLVLQG